METESAIREIFQSTHVFANRDAIAEQDRMRWTRAIRSVVDVVRIDSDESGV